MCVNKDEINDFNVFLTLYSLLIVTDFVSPLLKNRIKLYKDKNIDNITVYMVPSAALKSELTKPKKHMIKKEYSIYMNTFLREIKKNIPNVNLNAFYENSKNLSIEQTNMTFIKRLINANDDTSASFETKVEDYIPQYKIKFVWGKKEETIWHEFFHMASQRLYGNHVFAGFKQKFSPSKKEEKSFYIAQGFNEGYTEVLAERFFSNYGSKPSTSTGYMLMKNIALIIEKLVGRDKMQVMYFNSNLYGLCYQLNSFSSINDIISLLKNADIIEKYIKKPGCKSYCKNLYKNVLYKLFCWHINKVQKKDGFGIDSITNKILLDLDLISLFTKKINDVHGLSLDEIRVLVNSYLDYIEDKNADQINWDKDDKNEKSKS